MENKKEMNMILAIIIVLLVVGTLVFISISKKANDPENSMENSQVKNDMNINIKEGEVAKAGDVVSMNYTGRLEDGTVFDSNVDPKFSHVEPFTFNLGTGQVIAGWDKGIVGMKVGEKKTLIIKPEDGYGAAGAGSVIPPNATLIFDVELLAIKK